MTDKKTDDLIAQLSSESTQRKGECCPIRQTLLWLLGAGVLFYIGAEFIGMRDDVSHKMHEQAFVVELLAALATGLFGALAANWLAIPDQKQRPWISWLPLAPLAFFVAIAVYQFVVTPIDLNAGPRYPGCTRNFLLVTAIPAVLLFVLIRRAATTHSFMASAMAVLAVAAFGYIASRMICRLDDLSHLLFWHYLPFLGITIVSAVIGERLLRW